MPLGYWLDFEPIQILSRCWMLTPAGPPKPILPLPPTEPRGCPPRSLARLARRVKGSHAP
jgi:hypothetical protein